MTTDTYTWDVGRDPFTQSYSELKMEREAIESDGVPFPLLPWQEMMDDRVLLLLEDL